MPLRYQLWRISIAGAGSFLDLAEDRNRRILSFFFFVGETRAARFSHGVHVEREIIKACLWERDAELAAHAMRFSRNSFAVSPGRGLRDSNARLSRGLLFLLIFFSSLRAYREARRKIPPHTSTLRNASTNVVAHCFSIGH